MSDERGDPRDERGGQRGRGPGGRPGARGPGGRGRDGDGPPRGRRPGARHERGGRPERGSRGPAYVPGEEPTVRIKGHLTSPHPWIWRTRLEASSIPVNLPPGTVAQILDGDGEPIGRGLIHPHVTIGARILSFDPEEQIDVPYFVRRFEDALALRRDVLRLHEVSDAFRLTHAESDGVPGLVVDVYSDVVRVEVFARGMALLEEPIRQALGQVFPDKKVVVRSDRRTGEIEGFSIRARAEDPGETEVQEHGVRFRVDLREGHKTGFFLDQRDNRAFVAQLSRGRRVLDMHCYTGGFALHAAVPGQAAQVTGVDLDEKAIAVALKNAKLNQVQAKTRFVQADAFPYLREAIGRGDAPDMVILDPPKLAPDAKEKEQAMRTYSDLNRLGIECVKDGGLLLTCSCSGVISEEDFLTALRNAAARAGRVLTVFRVSGAADDHPVGLHVPETRYLKAVFARVKTTA